jgi:hypothetical protein
MPFPAARPSPPRTKGQVLPRRSKTVTLRLLVIVLHHPWQPPRQLSDSSARTGHPDTRLSPRSHVIRLNSLSVPALQGK